MKKQILLSLVLASNLVSASETEECKEVEIIESNAHCYNRVMSLFSHRLYGLIQGYITNDEPIDKNDLLGANKEFQTEVDVLLNDSVCGDIFKENIPFNSDELHAMTAVVTLDTRLHGIINPLNIRFCRQNFNEAILTSQQNVKKP